MAHGWSREKRAAHQEGRRLALRGGGFKAKEWRPEKQVNDFYSIG